MILDIPTCAAMLHCSEQRLRALARSETIPAAKVGRDWVFIEEDVVEWLRKRSQPRSVVVRKIGRPRRVLTAA